MNERIDTLKKQIEDIKNRLPAHSIPPAMMAELDDLEEQLALEIRKADKQQPPSDQADR